LQALVLKGIDGLIDALPTASSSHKDWSEFAKRYGEILARTHGLSGTEGSEHLSGNRFGDRIKALAGCNRTSDYRHGSQPSIMPT
jgi:hypothetical protein